MRRLLPVVALIILVTVGCSSGRNNPNTTTTTTGYDQYGNPIDPNSSQYGQTVIPGAAINVPQGSEALLCSNNNYIGSLVPSGQQDSICDTMYANPYAFANIATVAIRLWDGSVDGSVACSQTPVVGYLVPNGASQGYYDPFQIIPELCR